MERIAVIGSGIAGLSAARALSQSHERRHVTLFESAGHAGGHAHTVDVTLQGLTHGVDTGFLVYNESTYPRLTALFAQLGVETVDSDMSFSVQVPDQRLEWCGSSLDAVFAQRRNLARPAFWHMLADILRFNRLATGLARHGADEQLDEPVGAFIERHRFGTAFLDAYLLPMIGCIWSCPTQQMLAFPVGTLIRFCHNHGLLQVTGRPQWRTVRGGSRQYVRRMLAGLPDVRLRTPVLGVRRGPAGAVLSTPRGSEHYAQVVFACHSDQALALLGDDATPAERGVLGAIRYHANRAVLHTDVSMLPERRRAWAAWNHESGGGDGVCLHYLINRLQPLPWQQPVIVSLNPVRAPSRRSVLQSFEYAHPVFDRAAVAAQRRLHEIQGQRHSWFCGAWTGYGFHEDGLASGLAVAAAIDAGQSRAVLQGAA